MEEVLIDQFVNPLTRLEAGVELEQGFRPKDASTESLLDILLDFLVLELDETGDVVGIVLCKSISKVEDVHRGVAELRCDAAYLWTKYLSSRSKPRYQRSRFANAHPLQHLFNLLERQRQKLSASVLPVHSKNETLNWEEN